MPIKLPIDRRSKSKEAAKWVDKITDKNKNKDKDKDED
jgi:hypothetical protein